MKPPSIITSENIGIMLFYASITDGAIVEIGVYKGGSAWHLAKLCRPLFLYDTFDGLPCQGDFDGNSLGEFSDTSIDQVKDAIPTANVIKGVFPKSLIDMPEVGFVHADADQYESTIDICEYMPPLMKEGGIIYFDDYAVPGCEGCTKAVDGVFGNLVEQLSNGKAIVTI